MSDFIYSVFGAPSASAWLAMMVPVLIKSALILGAAGIITHLLRSSAAALRHLVWLTAMVGVLLLPVLGAVVPQVAVPVGQLEAVLPSTPANQSFEGRSAWTASRSSKQSAQSAQLRQNGTFDATRAAAPAATPAAVPHGLDAIVNNLARMPLTVWLLVIWAAGAVFLIARLIGSHVSAFSLVRRSDIVHDDDWNLRLERLCERLSIARHVRLRESDLIEVPVTVGSIRPAIVLPVEAGDWDEATRDSVLLHELAHIKRLDCMSQSIVEVVRALIWVNPLVWMAESQMRVERERACDDMVITSGTRASKYAQTLLELARSIRGKERHSAAVMAMARRSDLEGRLLDILDKRPRLRHVNRVGAAIAVAVVLCFVLPVAALTPAGQAQAETSSPAEWQALADLEAEVSDEHSALLSAELNRALTGLSASELNRRILDDVLADVSEAMADIELELAEAGIALDGARWESSGPAIDGDTLTIDQIIELAKHGVDADYIEELRATGYRDLSFETLLGFARHGIDAEYVGKMSSLGFANMPADDILQFARHGIDAELVSELRALGYSSLTADEIVELARHGIDADEVAEYGDFGLRGLSPEHLVELSRHGLDPEDVAGYAAAGYGELSVEQMIELARHGVDPECVEEINGAGFGRFSVDTLIGFAKYGVDADFLHELADAEITDLSAEEIVKLAKHGISAEYVKKMRNGQ